MKHYLFDHTNWGIICVFNQHLRSRWEASIMRFCILDTNFGVAMPQNAEYPALNNELIRKQFYQRSLKTGHGGFVRGSPSEVNDLFLRKQEQARLMYPVIARLVELLYNRSLSNINDYGAHMDDMLSYEIMNSDPNQGAWGTGVIEYAKTLNITPAQAYTELKIEFETSYAFKIRTLAYQRHYESKIRRIATQEDADIVMNDINEKLFIETMI